MSIESKYAKKNRELAVPYNEKTQKFKKISGVSGIVTILFIIMMIGVTKYRVVFYAIAFALGVVTAYLSAIFQTSSKKAERLEALPNQIDDYINEYKLSEVEVNALDRILEDMDKGNYTFKCEDTMITFSDELIVSVNNAGNCPYIEICVPSDIECINITKFINPAFDTAEFLFDFIDKRKTEYNIDFAQDSLPDGKDYVRNLISDNYPDVVINEMPDKTIDLVR